MENTEKLRESRNLLLKLHKMLVDHERATYEAFNGTTTSTEFLNLLLNDPDLEWLRRFSTLIVDIDEMFAQKDALTQEQVDAHLQRVKELIEVNAASEQFQQKYQLALQNTPEAAALHSEIKQLI